MWKKCVLYLEVNGYAYYNVKVCVLMCIMWVSLGLFLFVMYLATVFLGYLIDFIKDKFEK